MGEVIAKLKWAIKAGYKQAFLAVLAALAFFVLLFPYNDLSDLVSAQIAKQTQNQVRFQFTNMQPSFQPQPGLTFTDVRLENAYTPTLLLEELSLSPSLSAITSQQPHGKVSAQGLWGGSLNLAASEGEATQEGVARKAINLELESLELDQISKFAELPVNLKGSVTGEAQALVDLNLAVQPEADIDLKIGNFTLPNAPVQTPMGPFFLPEISLKDVSLKGRLSNGQLIIEEGQIGTEKDPIHGTIKGTIVLRLVKRGSQVVPQFGAYNLDLDLTMDRGFVERTSMIFTLVDGFIPAAHRTRIKSTTPKGLRYALKASGRPSAPPEIKPL